MIDKLDMKNFLLVKGLLEDYFSSIGRKHYNDLTQLLKKFENAVLSETTIVYYAHQDNKFVSAIALSQIERKKISSGSIVFFYIHSSFNEEINYERKLAIEKELIEEIIENLKNKCDYISVKNIDISEKGFKWLTSLGLTKYPRANMKISKEKILGLKIDNLLPDFELIPLDEEFFDEIAVLLVKSNIDHVDTKVFPEFSDVESAKEMMKSYDNDKSNNSVKEISFLLKTVGKIIGYCFITIFDGNTGFILDIGLDQDHRRKGLGKYLVVFSMKNLIKIDEKIEFFELAVTLENKSASNLYLKLGFEFSNYFDVYSWKKGEI